MDGWYVLIFFCTIMWAASNINSAIDRHTEAVKNLERAIRGDPRQKPSTKEESDKLTKSVTGGTGIS